MVFKAFLNFRFGYHQSKADYSLFTKTTSASITLVLIYVDDDLLISGNDMGEIESLKNMLCESFHMNKHKSN